jgi:hypothetical protein
LILYEGDICVPGLLFAQQRAHDAAAQRLGEAFRKLDALNQPPLTAEEVEAEIDAARAERRARHADRR